MGVQGDSGVREEVGRKLSLSAALESLGCSMFASQQLRMKQCLL